MNKLELEQRIVWQDVLSLELKKLGSNVINREVGTTSFGDIYTEAMAALTRCQQLPDDAPVPEEIISYWLALAGERIAKRFACGHHRRTDVLRYYAYRQSNIPLKEAMALSEDELVWMYFEWLAPNQEMREHKLSVVSG